ncbi:MAG: RHS repeat protein [Deltaproteobacteria bacterium]|nr:RHS repeat protein [Deltaproteobacteria bacterium]
MRTRWHVTKAHRVVSLVRPDRLRSLRAAGDCVVVGRGVDAATGRVLLAETDLSVAGPLPLELRRHYDSSLSNRSLSLGPGWSHVYEQAVWLEAGKVVVRAGDGRELELDTMHLPGEVIRRGDSAEAPLERFTLRCTGVHRYRIETLRGPLLHFERVAGDAQDGIARLVSVAHPAGPELRLDYDRHARLASVRDAAGRELAFEHDSRGRLLSVAFRDPTGRGGLTVASYERSPDGDLVGVRDADGRTCTYGYEGHLLVRATDPSNRSWYWGFDGTGPDSRCVRTWNDGGGDDRELRYRPIEGATTVVDGTGRKRVLRFDPVGTLLSDGERGTFTYDDELRLQTSTDLEGRVTRFEHDVRGHVSKIIEPAGHETVVELDAAGRPERVVTADGSEWRWRWDRFGQLVEAIDPLGHRTGFEHDAGLLRAVVKPGGHRTEVEYDAGMNVSVIRRSGTESRVAYDWLGRPLAVSESSGASRSLSWDAAGRLAEVRRPDGSAVRMTYERDGRLASIEDDAGVLRFTWDAAGRLASRTGPEGEVHIERDVEGRILAIRGPSNEHRTFKRDGLGRVTEETLSTGGRWMFRYAGGEREPSLVVPPSGGKCEIRRDAAGRVTEIRHDVAGPHEHFAYDPLGRLVEAKRGDHVVRLERDAAGHVVRERSDDDWIETQYDAAGRRIAVRDSTGTSLVFVRGGTGRIDAIDGQRGDVRIHIDVERDAKGAVAVRWLPGRVVSQWSRDGEGRVLTRATWQGDRPAEQVELGRDARGRLASVASSAMGLRRFERDAHGTVTAMSLGSRVVPRRADETLGLTFDGAGRLVERRDMGGARWRYRWSALGMLDEVTRPDGTSVRYAYDAFGRRIAKWTPAFRTRWIWDGPRAIAELSTEAPPTSWLHEPEELGPFGKLVGARAYCLASEPDALAVALHDDAGDVAWRALLDPSGRAFVEVAATPWPWRRSGWYEDEHVELVHARMRSWAPFAESFATTEPWGVAAGLRGLAGAPDPTEPPDPWALGPTAGASSWIDVGDLLPHSLVVARRVSDAAFAAFEQGLLVPPSLAGLGRDEDPRAILRTTPIRVLDLLGIEAALPTAPARATLPPEELVPRV